MEVKNLQSNNVKETLNSNKSSGESNLKLTTDTIDQLKNIEQEEKIASEPEANNKIEEIQINSLDELIKICEKNKELKFKYELENNLRLVSFKNKKIEISFSSNLDKSFVKELSAKLLEWTKYRWIIAFSKEKGQSTVKEINDNLQKDLLKKEANSNFAKEIKKIFPDAELLKIEEDNN